MKNGFTCRDCKHLVKTPVGNYYCTEKAIRPLKSEREKACEKFKSLID